jgi:cyclase
MSKKKIIPCLDIKDGKVVKGVHFVGLTDIGDPAEIARRYNDEAADEIVFLDITATNEGRDTHYALIARAAAELTIPLTVGGGVRTIEDFQKLFDAGASKVSVNSAAVARPALIAEASARFGKERVVVAIDAGNIEGRFQVLTNGGEVNTGKDLVAWARECEALGAGAILLTSIDADGAQTGYDIPMTRAVTESVGIPVIASGGCGAVEDIIQVFQETDCAAALAASLFHYGRATIAQVKREMERSGIPCL